MSIPKSKADIRQQLLVSGHDRIQPLEQGEVRIFHQSQSHHGIEAPVVSQGHLRPTPMPNVRQVVSVGIGFQPALPAGNTVLPSQLHGVHTHAAEPFQRGPHHWNTAGSHLAAMQRGPGQWVMPDPYGTPLVPADSDSSSDEEDRVDFGGSRTLRANEGEVELQQLPPPKRVRLPYSGSEGAGIPFAGTMSLEDLANLYRSTMTPPLPLPCPERPLPRPLQVQTFDEDLIRKRLRRQVNRDAEHPTKATPAGLPSAVIALWTKTSFEHMVEYVKTLEPEQSCGLLVASRAWKTTNPVASHLMALLYLFTCHSPPWEFVIELSDLLPRTWPPALEHLRQGCLLDWSQVVPTSRTGIAMRKEMLSKLNDRYSRPAAQHGRFAGMPPADLVAAIRSAMTQS